MRRNSALSLHLFHRMNRSWYFLFFAVGVFSPIALSVPVDADHGDTPTLAPTHYSSAPGAVQTPVGTCYVGRPGSYGPYQSYPSFVPVTQGDPGYVTAPVTSNQSAPAATQAAPAQKSVVNDAPKATASVAKSEPSGSADNSDPLVPNSENVVLTDAERAVIRLTNQLRQSAGKSILSVSQKLMDQARDQTKAQAAAGGMFHGSYAGVYENVANNTGPHTAESYFEQWRTSDGHFNNMMNGRSQIGVGIGARFATMQVNL